MCGYNSLVSLKFLIKFLEFHNQLVGQFFYNENGNKKKMFKGGSDYASSDISGSTSSSVSVCT
ncbi:hypothetical protein GCM10025861_05950 [Methanobacterium petrolearium]|nr:hypothetical protein GCM10025861_05950 [Methanobacterium petrolearium]